MKKVLISAGIIILLLILTIIAVTSSKRKFKYNPYEPFKGLTLDNVKSVLIVREGDSLRLFKEDGRWWVIKDNKKFLADSAMIKKRLKNILVARGSVVSRNPQKFEVFGIDTSNQKYFLFEDNKGKKYGPYYLGKTGQDFMSQYVRVDNMKEILLIDVHLGPYLNTETASWRVRRVFSISEEKIVQIIFEDSLGKVVLTRNDTIWDVVGLDSLPPQKNINNMLHTITSLYVSAFGDTLESSKCGFDKPYFSLTITALDGKKEIATVGKLADKYRYCVRVSSRDEVLLVGKGVIDRVYNFFRKKAQDGESK